MGRGISKYSGFIYSDSTGRHRGKQDAVKGSLVKRVGQRERERERERERDSQPMGDKRNDITTTHIHTLNTHTHTHTHTHAHSVLVSVGINAAGCLSLFSCSQPLCIGGPIVVSLVSHSTSTPTAVLYTEPISTLNPSLC